VHGAVQGPSALKQIFSLCLRSQSPLCTVLHPVRVRFLELTIGGASEAAVRTEVRKGLCGRGACHSLSGLNPRAHSHQRRDAWLARWARRSVASPAPPRADSPSSPSSPRCLAQDVKLLNEYLPTALQVLEHGHYSSAEAKKELLARFSKAMFAARALLAAAQPPPPLRVQAARPRGGSKELSSLLASTCALGWAETSGRGGRGARAAVVKNAEECEPTPTAATATALEALADVGAAAEVAEAAGDTLKVLADGAVAAASPPGSRIKRPRDTLRVPAASPQAPQPPLKRARGHSPSPAPTPARNRRRPAAEATPRTPVPAAAPQQEPDEAAMAAMGTMAAPRRRMRVQPDGAAPQADAAWSYDPPRARRPPPARLPLSARPPPHLRLSRRPVPDWAVRRGPGVAVHLWVVTRGIVRLELVFLEQSPSGGLLVVAHQHTGNPHATYRAPAPPPQLAGEDHPRVSRPQRRAAAAKKRFTVDEDSDEDEDEEQAPGFRDGQVAQGMPAPKRQRASTGGTPALLSALEARVVAAPPAHAPAVVQLRRCDNTVAATDEPLRAALHACTLWADVGSCAPADLLRGAEPQFWGALRAQGALIVRPAGTWDAARNCSALADLAWLPGSTQRLRGLVGEYQYIRQTLPRRNGVVELFENQISEEHLNGEYPFGALLKDVAEQFRFSAQPLRLLSPSERERLFLSLVRQGFPLQYPYLQGIALAAHSSRPRGEASSEGSPVNGCVRMTPPQGAHAWDPCGLAVLPGSIVVGLLKACEAACNPALQPDADGDGDGERGAGRLRFQPLQPPRLQADAERAEEIAVAGATAVAADPQATLRRLRRRQAGVYPDRPQRRKRAEAERTSDADAAAEEVDLDAPRLLPHEAAAAAAHAASQQRLWGAGIVTPWLYYMGAFSSFAAHFEDYAFGSANVLVAEPGSSSHVIWYSVPRESLHTLHLFLRHLLGDQYTLDVLEQRRLWIDPAVLGGWNAQRAREGLPEVAVHRHVQGPGEYVITDYGSVHWGVNVGVGWKVAVNFAFEEWGLAAAFVDDVYTRLERETGLQRSYRCAPPLAADPHAQRALCAHSLAAMATAGAAPLAPLEEREAAGRAAVQAALSGEVMETQTDL